MTIFVEARAADFEVGAELARLESLGGGGVASFTGVVRGAAGLSALRLEAYPGLTQRTLEAIAATAAARWELLGLTLIHRHGTLGVGERIVLVATAARHRAAALDACAFLIDRAKTRAAFWKQEMFADGTAHWIEARREDDDAAAEWDTGAEEGRRR